MAPIHPPLDPHLVRPVAFEHLDPKIWFECAKTAKILIPAREPGHTTWLIGFEAADRLARLFGVPFLPTHRGPDQQKLDRRFDKLYAMLFRCSVSAGHHIRSAVLNVAPHNGNAKNSQNPEGTAGVGGRFVNESRTITRREAVRQVTAFSHAFVCGDMTRIEALNAAAAFCIPERPELREEFLALAIDPVKLDDLKTVFITARFQLYGGTTGNDRSTKVAELSKLRAAIEIVKAVSQIEDESVPVHIVRRAKAVAPSLATFVDDYANVD